MNVRLHIERLVFDGFKMTPAERVILLDATQAELGRLLAINSESIHQAAGFSTPVISAGEIQQTASSLDPVSFGNQLARVLYRGLGGQGE